MGMHRPEVSSGDDAHSAPRPAEQAQISIADDGHVAIRLSRAKLRVVGPAAVTVESDEIRIYSGRVEIAGHALVHGPRCSVTVDGRADAFVAKDSLEVKVQSGRADASDPSCTVSYAAELMQAAHDSDAISEGPAEPRVARPRAVSVATSALRQQLDDLKRARTLLQSDKNAGIRELRSFVRTWPKSPLREEAEAGIVLALVAIGQPKQVEAAVREFILRYPTSPRTKAFEVHLRASQ